MNLLKRLMDIVISGIALLVLSPVLAIAFIAVWQQDYHSPIYSAPRVGLGEKLFKMFKTRSMIINADKSGVDSTGAADRRITPIGQFIRRYKLDELPQLWNVFWGDMSLVGPRPNVKRETDLYSPEEKVLLTVRPGITDFASIVFSDEGEILKDEADPDLAYNQLIRPWKSRLGLFYIKHKSVALDFKLLVFTAVAIVSRNVALKGVNRILIDLNADQQLCRVSLRQDRLSPTPPPGMSEVVAQR